MKKQSRFLFWFIIVLTILVILIDFPNELHINFTSPKVPILNKEIKVDRIIYGMNNLLAKWRIPKQVEFRKGLDLEGGSSVTLLADMKGIGESQRDAALESSKNIIERRVNFYGVSEPVIQTAKVNNEYRIIVELPGITDVQQAISLIGKTAKLTFWEEGQVATAEAQIATPSANIPQGLNQLFTNPKLTNLTGADLEQTNVGFDQNTSSPQVELVFTSEGAKKFEDITRRNVDKIVTIALDDQVIQAPRVNQVIVGGRAVITGGFTTEQAKAVSIQLNAGALPVSLNVLEQKTVGATLGEESLVKSVFAGIVGFASIVIFMCVLYGRLGVIAGAALVLYCLFVLAIFKFIPVTLTLAGIAGFVLSVGMAVDANILIFERMREELRRGRSREVALELGFTRAWSSIRDSNVSSIITAMILIYFGTGIVRGFAITLLIGVLVSMFSAITVTRTFLRLIYK